MKRVWKVVRCLCMISGVVTCCFVTHSVSAQAVTRVLTLNPYQDVVWDSAVHAKANLHTHTTSSDGAMPPHRVVDEYHSRGYKILAITDHDRVTWPWSGFSKLKPTYEDRDPEALGMLAIPGNELSRHHHTQSLFSEFETTERDHDSVLAAQKISAPNARTILNHPAWHWSRNHPATGFKVPIKEGLRDVTQGDFTLEAWFRTSNTNRNIILGNYADSNTGAANLELHTNNRVRLYLRNEDGKVLDRNLDADTIDTRDGEWHHLAGVRLSGQVALYIDGQQLRAAVTDTLGSYSLQGDTFWLGRDTRAGSTEFKGDLDQIRIWRRGLTAAEVAALAEGGSAGGSGVSDSDLLAQYTFDRLPELADLGGHVSGPYPAICDDSGYRIAPGYTLRQITQGNFTLCAWFRTNDKGRNLVMGNYVNATLGALNLELHTDNRVRLFLQPPAGSGKSTVDINIKPDVDTRDGKWHHLAGVRNGSQVALFLDGREVASVSDSAGHFLLPEREYYLMRDGRSGSTVFKGDCDNWQIWQRALSVEELEQLVNKGREAVLNSSSGLLVRYRQPLSTVAHDSAGSAAGPFDGESDAFSSLLRVHDEAPLQAEKGSSGAAIRLGWEPAYPDKVPAEVLEKFAGLFERHNHLVGVEVLNGTMQAREYPLDRELWDMLLTRFMPERPIWGFAHDDMHSIKQLGRDVLTFLLPELSEGAMLHALDNGTFTFASTRVRPWGSSEVEEPPRLVRVIHDIASGTITLQVESEGGPLPDSACSWIADGVKVHSGMTYSYRTDGLENGYVRAEIQGPGGILHLNPFGFKSVERVADSDADGLPDWWELAWFGSVTAADPGESSLSGMTMMEHYIAGTNPHEVDSAFHIAWIAPKPLLNSTRLCWPSVEGRFYAVEFAPSLESGFQLLAHADAIGATPPTNIFDVPYTGKSGFYRLRVRVADDDPW